MTTWEERMAAKAAARRAVEPVPPVLPNPYDVHRDAGHHVHLNGTSVFCSCGADRGTTTVAMPPPGFDFNTLACDVCGERGVVLLGR